MKKRQFSEKTTRVKKVACTVSAAALMLGVSHAATVAMHFQVNYCGYASYSGFPVTLTAFGVPANGWQNLTPMNSGYGACALAAPYYITLNEAVSTTTATDGLNPLPNGALNVTWSANTANFSGFGGYVDAGNSPAYNILTFLLDQRAYLAGGEDQVYAGFLRDGVNFGPPGGADNAYRPGGYVVDVTGLSTVFTNSQYVVELIAASDSMQTLTNAFVIDVNNSITNSVTYSNTPPVLVDQGGAPWLRGHGGGLSTVTLPLRTDHIRIFSSPPAHGGTGVPPSGYDQAGTISGFIVTDKPVVTMSPRSVTGSPGDSVTLNPFAIGVPPLAYQWRKNGSPISGATNPSLTITNLNAGNSGNYDLVVTNSYGSAISKVAVVTADPISITYSNVFLVDTNPASPPRFGANNGARWLASSSDGTIMRTGVMEFVATNNDGITVPDSTNFDSSSGTFTFWMRTAGTDTNAPGEYGAAILGRPGLAAVNDLIVAQTDEGGGNVAMNAPGGVPNFGDVAHISDNNWHFVCMTYSTSANGGAAIYVDDVLGATGANKSAWSPPVGQPIQIGFTTSIPYYRAYNGMLNDVRFYNRQLTSAEINTVYTTGALIDTNALQLQLTFKTPPLPGVTLNWQTTNSVLQAAPAINGPYSDVPAAVSPSYIMPTGTQTYYRYRFSNAPRILVSNPYLM